METLFELTFQDQTLNPQVGTFTDTSQTTGTFTLEDGEYYLTNGDTKGFYAYSPVAMQSGLVDDSKVIIEFDLKVVTASVNTHTIIGTYAGVDGNGIPTGDKITLQYNAGDIELVLGSGTTATLIEFADVVVDQWYHFRIDCYLAAPLVSTYQVKIDGVMVTTVTGATTDYELGIISVLGTDLHACDECGIKNITLVTETNLYVGRTALDQALQDVKGYVDNQVGACVPLAGSNQISGSLIPATTDAYDLGGSSYQWNNAYIKSLTINGVAAGDILTHNASEFVDVSSNQTIGGAKIFSSSPRVTKKSPDIALNISDCDVTELPTEAKFASLLFRDKNNKNLAYIIAQQRVDGEKRICIRTHRTDNINNYYSVDLDSDGDLYPEQNNSLRLGTPALQWNNTYTRNILIDNDINIASSVINKTSNSGTLALRGGTNPNGGASIGLYGKDYTGALSGCVYITAYGNSDNTNFCIFPNGTISVYNNSTATTKNVAMQEDVIPLAGSNAISGSLIPATDNSIDVGSSTKNIKMLYTKGITIDAKTIDTDANDNMTYDGHIIDTIEEQGDGYIRYSNGLQICWTTNQLVTQSSSGTWTYPKTFISVPCILWQAIGNNTAYIDAVNGGDLSPSNATFIPSRYISMDGSVVTAPYGVNGLAIGRWK